MNRDDSSSSLKKILAEQEVELTTLSQDLDSLRVRYEQYFAGLERREPSSERNDLARRFRLSKVKGSQSHTIRFRFNALQQRFISYSSYWQRTVRQIEEGNFRREGFGRFKMGPLTPERVNKGEARATTERRTEVSEEARAGAKETAAEAAAFMDSLSQGGSTKKAAKTKTSSSKKTASSKNKGTKSTSSSGTDSQKSKSKNKTK